MRKLSVILFLFVGILTAEAQHQINSFFDERGGVRPETIELSQSADTLVSVFHRADDIVWSRIVYRVIDMRYKQNYQLYFPTRADDKEYRSLFKLMIDAIIDGLPIYRKEQDDIKPSFDLTVDRKSLPQMLITGNPLDDNMDWNIATSSDFLLNYDSINDLLSFQSYSYDTYVRNQLKFLIQEIIFFDKHTSRLYSKIIAIAPLQPDQTTLNGDNIMQFLWSATKFWISFDQLRPYLAKQYVIPNGNDKARVTYDEFFIKKLYSSYLIGDSNMYSRMFLNYTTTEKDVIKEQKRVEDELLNFEQDLWEY